MYQRLSDIAFSFMEPIGSVDLPFEVYKTPALPTELYRRNGKMRYPAHLQLSQQAGILSPQFRLIEYSNGPERIDRTDRTVIQNFDR
jgi:hypothetical protein